MVVIQRPPLKITVTPKPSRRPGPWLFCTSVTSDHFLSTPTIGNGTTSRSPSLSITSVDATVGANAAKPRNSAPAATEVPSSSRASSRVAIRSTRGPVVCQPRAALRAHVLHHFRHVLREAGLGRAFDRDDQRAGQLLDVRLQRRAFLRLHELLTVGLGLDH